MKKMFSILSVLLFLVSAHVASFGSVCFDNDGFHVDISTQHGCCESEAVTHCDSDDDCFDLVLEYDVTRQSSANEDPGITLAQICTGTISYEDVLSSQAAVISVHTDLPPLASSPLAAIRSVRLLV